jgi:hypothetical protein
MPAALPSPALQSALASDLVMSVIVVDEDPPIEDVHVQVQSFLQEANVKRANAPNKITFFMSLIFNFFKYN